jgi:cell division protein ZapE
MCSGWLAAPPLAMKNAPLIQAYAAASRSPGFVDDASQRRAIAALQQCFNDLHSNGRSTRRGVYLWGPAGRGKTWLMDMFHQQLRQPSRRQHFHHFMQWVHRRLFAMAGTADPLRHLAAELATEIRILCFDELFVTDIGDAMLLGGLFQVMFDAGITIVATSNQAPQQLYADGFNRERFLPAIHAITHSMQSVEVDGGQDHRLHAGEQTQRYWVNDAGALRSVFKQLSGTLPISDKPLLLNGRQLAVIQHSEAAAWIRFDDLCGQAFAAPDFMALCDRFPNILLSAVPGLSGRPQAQKIARGTEDSIEQVVAGDRRLPALAASDNSVRRFIALVDECYDRRIPLYLDAAVPLNTLYTDGYLTAPFRRTFSRLQAMQYRHF